MNCRNCGAAMELVESRRHFRCAHCGTYHFHDGIDAEGIRIVGLGDAVECPVCAAAMVHAELDARHAIDFCTTCRGFLLPRATFAGVINARRAWATSPPTEPPPLDRRELDRALACPKCRKPFATYAHYGPGNVVLDNCTDCDVIWLDFGEMRQIVDAPGRDRGSKHAPRIDDEYVRQGPPKPVDEDEDEDAVAARRRKHALGALLDVLLGS